MPSLKQIGNDGRAAAPPAPPGSDDAPRPDGDPPSSDPRPPTRPAGGRPGADAEADGPASRTAAAAAAGAPGRTRLVVLRPSLPPDGGDRDGDGDADCQWPLRRRHERSYRLAVRVETLLRRVPPSGDVPSGRGGATTTMTLIGEDGTEAPLAAAGERLTVVRPACAPGGETDADAAAPDAPGLELHPGLAEGDVITTLDGLPGPTYGEMYRMMCRGEKLVLEVRGNPPEICPRDAAAAPIRTDGNAADPGGRTWSRTPQGPAPSAEDEEEGEEGDEELAAFDLEGAVATHRAGRGGDGGTAASDRNSVGAAPQENGGPVPASRMPPFLNPGTRPPSASTAGGRKRALPARYVTSLRPADVVCGRRTPHPPPGNAAYESLVSSSRGRYASSSREEKGELARGVMDEVAGGGGRFVRRVAEGALKERGLAGGGVVYELLDEETVLAKIRAGLRERPAAAATTANGKGKTANGNGKSSAGPAAVSRSSVSSSSAPSGADGPPAKRPRSSSASSRSSGAPGPDGKSPEVEFVGSTEEVEFLGSREPAAAGYNPLLARRALAATRLGGRTEEQTGAPTGSREAGGVSDVAAPGSVRPAAAGYNPLAAREALRLAASRPGERAGELEGSATAGYNPLAARQALAKNRLEERAPGTNPSCRAASPLSLLSEAALAAPRLLGRAASPVADISFSSSSAAGAGGGEQGRPSPASSTSSSSSDSSMSCSSSSADASPVRPASVAREAKAGPLTTAASAASAPRRPRGDSASSGPSLPPRNRASSLSVPPPAPPAPPPVGTSRRRPAPGGGGGGEAPTSLKRLWPDPTDVIKAMTGWIPPGARTVARGGGGKRSKKKQREAVEFHGPLRSVPPGGSDNPLLTGGPPGPQQRHPPPLEFRDANDAMSTLARPILEEGLASLNSAYRSERRRSGAWDRDVHRLRLTRLTEVSPIFAAHSFFDDGHEVLTTYEAQLSAHSDTPPPPSALSELYVLSYPGWDGCRLGIVAHDFPTTASFRSGRDAGSGSTLRLWITVRGGGSEEGKMKTKGGEGKDGGGTGSNTGWLTRRDLGELLDMHKKGLAVRDRCDLVVMSCGSTTNIVRQFEAVKCLPYLKPHLRKALFATAAAGPSGAIKVAGSGRAAPPSGAASSGGGGSRPIARPTSLPVDIWRGLQNTMNPFQLSSVSRLLSGSCRENVCLVQGPPGTGKSSTIVGLVSALLSGKAPLPRQRQSGCIIHPGKTMGATVSGRTAAARNRILVCAATNQAVDGLAWRIRSGSVGPSGKVGDFEMARYGSLPWEQGARGEQRDARADQARPGTMSEMENFLYDINVDRRASEGSQDFVYDDVDHDGICWSPDGAKSKRPRKRRKIIGRGRVRARILGSCSVVVTTLSGAGSKAFIDAVCRDPARNDSEFDAVIIDEACQASEPESLIPFKYNPTTLCLVGDPQQLPVLTLSGSAANNKLFERSLFERLQSLNFPTILLRNQYRMHEEIASFPSRQFYEGRLITPDEVRNRRAPLWTRNPCFPTVCFWDLRSAGMTGKSDGHGFKNADEADFIMRRLLPAFAQECSSSGDITVGIITFYRDQVKLLRDMFEQVRLPSFLKLKIATVDGFQGSECDVIILSCVRSQPQSARDNRGRNQVGFLNDYRRVNVSLTRAKSSLWIVGDAQVLESSQLWRRLLDHVDRNSRALRRADQFQEMYARWKASLA